MNYIKSRNSAPKGFFEAEGEGLKWLREPYINKCGVDVVKVFKYDNNSLEIEQVISGSPTAKSAYNFGANLAKTHFYNQAELNNFGWGWTPSAPSYFGPLSDPVLQFGTQDLVNFDNWFDYFVNGRMRPMIELGIKRNEFSSSDLDLFDNTIKSLTINKEEMNSGIARCHGDLWSGNLMWRQDGEAVLIDPAAHIGHFEEDLAMLNLFGCPFYNQILKGYNSIHPLSPDFKKRITLHNLYPIAGHVVFFGGGYLNQFRSMLITLT
jgi:fructosamine-3-kinase